MRVWQKDDWIGRTVHAATSVFWRAVEAQHRVATLRLVDTLDEQALLAEILEASKPRLPPAYRALHHLLSTPFCCPSP